MHLSYREATLKDVPAIFMIRLQAKDNPLCFELSYEMLSQGLRKNCEAFVAFHGDQMVAFSLVNQKTGNLWGLFVLAEYQNQGIGSLLLSMAMKSLFAPRGLFRRVHKKIWLETKQDAPARRYYYSKGFVETALIDGRVQFELNYSDYQCRHYTS